MVTVPVPPVPVVHVVIDDNVNGAVLIRRELVVRKRQFFVRASPRQYQVVGYDQEKRASWVPNPTDCLDLSCVNVFRAGANGGVQLAPGEPLGKGRAYFVLARLKAWTEPPAGLFRDIPRVDFCDPKREWVGGLVYLPRAKRADINSWCERVAKRELVDPPPDLDLVLPPARAVQPDGAYAIAAGEELVLSLRGGDWIEPIVEVVNEETGKSEEWDVEVEADEFIRLGKFQPGTYAVHVRDWELVSLRLAVVEADPPNVLGVALRTVALGGETESLTGLFDAAAVERWEALLSGRELWRGIDLPDSWALGLHWTTGALQVHRQELATPEAVAASFSDCLEADPDYAALDAGVYGTIAFQKPVVLEKAPAANSLPAALCARLRWLTLARSAAALSPTVPLSLAIPAERAVRLCKSDRRLVTDFLEVARWPVTLIPQARAVGKELFRQLDSER